MPKMRDDPAGKEARFLQATDEMSAALTQFMKKKIYEEQLANFLDGEEYVLEDQPIEKPTKLWRRLRLQLPMTMKCIALLKIIPR